MAETENVPTAPFSPQLRGHRTSHFEIAIDPAFAVLYRAEVTMMQMHVDRTETIRSDGRPCPCGRVSVVTILGADTVNILRNSRNGAFRVVQSDEVVDGGSQGYRVSLRRNG